MERVSKVFMEFLKANGMAPIADFRSRAVFYRTPWSEKVYTEEQLRGTAEFAGFCNGYEGNPNRYDGSIGTPNKVLREGVQNALSRLGGKFEYQETLMAKLTESAELQLESRYSKQYELGRTAKAIRRNLEDIY